MTTKGSTTVFAAKGPDHLLPEGKKWPPKGQQQVFQKRDQITYKLRVGDANKGSIAGFAAKRPDHLLPEGRRWPPKGQQHILQKRDQITYKLRAGDSHQRVSSMFCRK